MADKYTCNRCGASGSKKLIPYKVVKDDNGESVKFVKQLCDRCFTEIFEKKNGPAPEVDNENVKE